MGDDPILQIGIVIGTITMPILSVFLSKKNLKYIFIIPVSALIIAFPLFLLTVIIQGTNLLSKFLFYTSMILWTSGFISGFVCLIIYLRKKNINKQSN